jgi:hypothetical protein
MKNKIIYPALLSFVFVFAGYAWGVSKQHLALISIIMAVNLVVIRAKTDFALILNPCSPKFTLSPQAWPLIF